MLYYGFSRGFRFYGFQTGPLHPTKAVGGNKIQTGKKDYFDPYAQRYEWQLQNAKRLKLESERIEAANSLRAQELKIEALEIKRLQKDRLADLELQLQLIELLKQRELLSQLLAELERQITILLLDDDALIVLLLSNPFG